MQRCAGVFWLTVRIFQDEKIAREGIVKRFLNNGELDVCFRRNSNIYFGKLKIVALCILDDLWYT